MRGRTGFIFPLFYFNHGMPLYFYLCLGGCLCMLLFLNHLSSHFDPMQIAWEDEFICWRGGNLSYSSFLLILEYLYIFIYMFGSLFFNICSWVILIQCKMWGKDGGGVRGREKCLFLCCFVYNLFRIIVVFLSICLGGYYFLIAPFLAIRSNEKHCFYDLCSLWSRNN